VFVFLVEDKYFYLVAYLKTGLVAEFRKRHKTIRLKADVENHVAVGDGCYGSLYHLVGLNYTEGTCIEVLEFLAFFFRIATAFFAGAFPVKIAGSRGRFGARCLLGS